jgi:hypothetical protein
VPSPTELLKLAASNSISPEDLERELGALAKGHQRRARKYKGGDVRIYRARVWHRPERPQSVAELSYPPKSVTPQGRANAKGEPVFYASAGLPPSFVEYRLKTGDHVVCSEWRNTAELILQEVGLSDGWATSEVERVIRADLCCESAERLCARNRSSNVREAAVSHVRGTQPLFST